MVEKAKKGKSSQWNKWALKARLKHTPLTACLPVVSTAIIFWIKGFHAQNFQEKAKILILHSRKGIFIGSVLIIFF